MTAVIETFLRCDECGESFGEYDKQRNITKQREIAKINGWIYSGNKDMCPACRPKNKDDSLPKSR